MGRRTYTHHDEAGAVPPRRLSLYHRSLRPLLTCRSIAGVLQAHAHLITSGLIEDPFAASRLLKVAAFTAPLPYTLLLFRRLPSPDTFCANTVIKALSLSPHAILAVEFFVSSLRSGFVPNSYTFPVLFAACARASALDAGEMCHGQAVKRRVDGVLPVGNSIVHMYASCGLIGEARMLFDEMPVKDEVSWNSVIDGYMKVGDVVAARELFESMPRRNVVSWNVMIGGYVKLRSPELGLELFRDMRKKGVGSNEKTMTSVVTACGRLGRLMGGKSVHSYYLRNFAEENMIFGTTLVDMYSRCRRVELAKRVFDGMSKRNLICWNAMILGLCIYGNPEDGLALFHEMVGEDCNTSNGEDDDDDILEVSKSTVVTPDEVTFIGVLCACARRGLLTEGKKYFNQMIKLYNLKPTFAHHWCMANLYGRLGMINEAIEVLQRLPEETESLVLGGLLGLCRFHGEIEMGESIARKLIELEPYNGSRYALLQSIYVAAGKWEEAHKVKEFMKEKGIRPVPRHRLVHLNEIVHNFTLGDSTHPEIEHIYRMLDDLSERLRLGDTVNMIDNEQL